MCQEITGGWIQKQAPWQRSFVQGFINQMVIGNQSKEANKAPKGQRRFKILNKCPEKNGR